MTVTIRRVVTADAGRARALRLEMLADTPLAFITTLAEFAAAPHAEYAGRITRGSAGTQTGHFVADAGRELVGQVIAVEHPDQPDTSMLFAVYVSPEHRGGRVLADLIDAAATWSRECGRERLELEVVTTNVRATKAYRKLGFQAIGGPVPHPTIPALTEQVMVRRS